MILMTYFLMLALKMAALYCSLDYIVVNLKQKSYYWRIIKKDCQQFKQSCILCYVSKYIRTQNNVGI